MLQTIIVYMILAATSVLSILALVKSSKSRKKGCCGGYCDGKSCPGCPLKKH